MLQIKDSLRSSCLPQKPYPLAALDSVVEHRSAVLQELGRAKGLGHRVGRHVGPLLPLELDSAILDEVVDEAVARVPI